MAKTLKKRELATKMALALVIMNIVSCAPKNGNTEQPSKCRTPEELQEIMNQRSDLIDQSEYDMLNVYGKPPFVSMNSRSEKLYYYQPCDSTQASVIIRFSGIGRVKEVYMRAN